MCYFIYDALHDLPFIYDALHHLTLFRILDLPVVPFSIPINSGILKGTTGNY